jgi:hypothetical protein
MAIDPRIPLGVQPIQQQPNMLGQYAQIMAIKAAQQDIQGNEDLRAAYAQGGDLNDPEFRRRVMAANPKLGSELIKRNAETGKLQNEAVLKRIELSREMLTGVNTPEDYIAWHESNHKDPVLGGYLSQRGITAEQSRAKIIADLSKPGGLDKLKRESALGATTLQKELMQTERSTKVAGISAAATMRGQDLLNAREIEKREYDRANPKLQRADGELGFILYNDRDPNSGQYLSMRPPAAAPVAQPSAVNNLMMTTQPTPSVNALTQPAPNQAGPTVAAANALVNQPTIPRPKQQIRQPVLTEVDDPATPGQKLRVDANVYQQGTTLGAPGVFGVARTEKLTPAQQQKLKGEISKDFEAVERVVGQTNELLESIDAVRSSNLEKVAGPVDARTPSFFTEAQVAESRFNNLKGKVTAIAKANASLGGAIGSIANQEWQILANQIAVLDLAGGKTANLEQIEQLERQAMSIVARMRDGFERQYGADVETLAPQYKDVPNVNYKPGQYTKTGKIKSGVDNDNPLLK